MLALHNLLCCFCLFIYSFYFTFAENHLIPTEVRKEALQLQKLLEYDDEGAEG